MSLTPLSEKEYRAIIWGSRCSSLLSLAGLSFVVGSFLFSNRFRTPINRLIFYASWGNLFVCAAVLMSVSPIRLGPDLLFCQIQAFIIDWYGYFACAYFLRELTKIRVTISNPLWALCMAWNVYLAFFQRYDASKLRWMDKVYIGVCYGLPFVPAFTCLFIKNERKGKVYGSATVSPGQQQILRSLR
jgi:hypothetical protein